MIHTILFLVVLGGTFACTRSNDGETSTRGSNTDKTIPFEREGQLTFIQDGDSTVVLDIEIAETDSARQRGMMQREGFPDETSGMLFLFDDEEPRSFWMANTPVALDLLFLSADSQVVSIHKYARPYSSESIESGDPARYVLETPAGFVDQYGIVEGDRARWHRFGGSTSS